MRAFEWYGQGRLTEKGGLAELGVPSTSLSYTRLRHKARLRSTIEVIKMSKFFPFETKEASTLERLVPRQGAQTTRAGVYGEVPTNLPIGTLYQSTAGKLYQKVSQTPASTDWQRVTATAVD